MNEDYKLAIRTILKELRKSEAKMSSLSKNLYDDCKLLKHNKETYEKERERMFRYTHGIVSNVVRRLPIRALYQLAVTSNPNALWRMPSTYCASNCCRRRLIAHAMHGLVARLLK
ncbi:MAG: hypothetical protein ACSHX6_14570 [Akkermansiaceae bacterium]